MKTYIQTTFTLNITVLESGALQVEGFEPAFQSPAAKPRRRKAYAKSLPADTVLLRVGTGG